MRAAIHVGKGLRLSRGVLAQAPVSKDGGLMRARRLCVHSVPSRIAKSIHVRPGPANGTAKGFRESAERKGRSGVLLPWGADRLGQTVRDATAIVYELECPACAPHGAHAGR